MNPEQNSGAVWVHPFFDPDSTYRLLTQDNFWADGGLRCVRAFFERQRRRQLRERHRWGPPEEVEWETGPYANRAIRDYLRAVRHNVNAAEREEEERSRRAAREKRFADAELAGALEGAGSWPVLLTFDLTQAPPTRVGGAIPPGPFSESPARVGEARPGEGALFTGIGLQEQPEISHFHVDITGLEPGQRCLVLLLEEALLDPLRRALPPPAPERPEDVIGRALAEAVPPQAAGTEARRRARRLQEVWACVEGLELTADRNGWLQGELDLARPSRLDPSTRVVLCHGPKAA